VNLIERAKAYANGVVILTEWLGSGGIVVDPITAQDRAGTCLNCPKNNPGWKAPEAIAAKIKEQLELKNQMNLKVTGERSLGTCDVCLCALRLKAWVPIGQLTKYMTPDQFAEYPAHCWIRTETKL